MTRGWSPLFITVASQGGTPTLLTIFLTLYCPFRCLVTKYFLWRAQTVIAPSPKYSSFSWDVDLALCFSKRLISVLKIQNYIQRWSLSSQLGLWLRLLQSLGHTRTGWKEPRLTLSRKLGWITCIES